MKKLAILFLFIFTASLSFGQNLTIEDTLNNLSDAELYQLVLSGQVPMALGVMHDAFLENPEPLAQAVSTNKELKDLLVFYAAAEEQIVRESYEVKLLEDLY